MQKYNIEGNINFYDELFKSLDDDSDDESNLCLISGFPLDSKSVTLECNHKFNYEPLYKEICRQKFKFKTYDPHTLSKQDQIKIRASALDYFIKCPYCRNVQFTILPYNEELNLTQRYGVNSLDPSLPDKPKNNNYSGAIHYGSDNFTFWAYNKLFKKGQCHFVTNPSTNVLCNHIYVTSIESINKSYCKYHYKSSIKTMKLNEKQKLLDERIKQKEEKQKLLDEKNAERLAKGLVPLKRLPIVKKKVQNVVQNVLQIGQYVPEDAEVIVCKSILKTGPNKGSPCGCKKIYKDGLCKRHSLNDKETKEDVNNDL